MASMKAPMPASILHDGQGNQPPSTRRQPRTAGKKNPKKFLGVLGVLCGESFGLIETPSGGSLPLGKLRGAFLHSLGAALAHQKEADPFQQVRRRIHPPRQEDVGLRFMIVDAYLARNEDGWSVRR